MNLNKYVNYTELETKTIEYKEIVSHKNYEKWLKEIAAFANTEGGKIFFGIDDDERIVGMPKEIAKSEILYINDICDKKLYPRVKIDFDYIKVPEDIYVIEVIVHKNDNTPVWMIRSDEQEVIYIRREGQSVIAHGEQIENLVLENKRIPFDVGITSKKYNDLSFEELQNIYKERNHSKEEISIKSLTSMYALSDNGNVKNGLLLFNDDYDGKNCNIACRVWKGLSKGSSVMLDKKTFKGNVFKVLEFARNYIAQNTKSGVIKLDNGGRTAIYSYPKAAVEEALINAVAHRDYYINGTQIDIDIFTNRIEITSPGNFLLPGNAQDYQMNKIPSKRRNEIICNILEKCKMMEASGSGFDKISDEYEGASKDKQPLVYSDPAQFIITLFDLNYEVEEQKVTKKNRVEFKSPRSGNREYDEKILLFCLDTPKSRIEIQNYIELSDRKNFVNTILNPLLDSELLLTTQASRFAPNQKYYTNSTKIKIFE